MQLTESLRDILQQEVQHHALPNGFIDTVQQWYLPVASRLASLKKARPDTLLVSFNGSQGSGKSTITAFLRLILIHQYELNTVEMSIDDFYLTHRERQQLADRIHPLFATRGVPGTHDVELANQTLACLRQCADHNPCSLPRFNKAVDDRKPEKEWPVINNPVDIILFEGWCNHAPVQTPLQLQQPINDLERDEDANMSWRQYANDSLRIYHEKLFNQADHLIFLQAPSFEMVYEWRGLQEKKLAASATNNKHGVMDDQQLRRFIQHYERITRQCLKALPETADIVIQLDASHSIRSINFGSDET